MAQIGLRNLYYAVITDGASGETYGTPAKISPAVSADMSVDVAQTIFYADDGADTVVNEFSKGTLTLETKDIPTAVQAVLLGARVDAKGALISNSEDTPPYVAIGFQSKTSAGGYRYFWLYRGKFSIPGESFKTKGENIEFTTRTLEYTFTRRNKADTVGTENHPWKAEINSDDSGADATTISGWFSSVYEPGTAPSVSP